MSSRPDYGVKLPLAADVIIEGCHGCTVEGYALSDPENGDLMDVALIAEPRRDVYGRKLPIDDVGVVLTENRSDIERMFLYRVLMREAKKPKNLLALQYAYNEYLADRREAGGALTATGCSG